MRQAEIEYRELLDRCGDRCMDCDCREELENTQTGYRAVYNELRKCQAELSRAERDRDWYQNQYSRYKDRLCEIERMARSV